MAGSTYVVINVVTGAREQAKKRPPFSLAVVLDRSGSMGGEKMASSKAAIKRIIDEVSRTLGCVLFWFHRKTQLNLDDDLSFIVFDDKLEVVFVHGDLTNKELLKSKVDGVIAKGSTFLSGGMVVGAMALGCQPYEVGSFTRKAVGDYHFLADVPAVGESKNAKRVFLFSDGAANKGLVKLDELSLLASDICEAGATISTFGIGRDFNEAVMTSISKSGHGGFTYIKKPSLIEQYVADALGNMKRLIGTNAQLTVRGTGTAIVKRIFDHSGNVASLKDVRESNKVQVVVELQVAPSDAVPPSDSASILEWELSYVSSETGATVTQSGHLDASFTRDAAAATVVNAPVRSAVLQLQSGEVDNEITALLDAGKRQEAIDKKKAALDMLRKAHELDPTGFAGTMLSAGEKTLKHLESARSANKVKKTVQYSGYLQRRASISAMDQLGGYIIESDSSSEDEDKKMPQKSKTVMRPPIPSLGAESDSDEDVDYTATVAAPTTIAAAAAQRRQRRLS